MDGRTVSAPQQAPAQPAYGFLSARFLVSLIETVGIVIALILAVVHKNHDAFIALLSALTAHGILHN